MSKKQIILLMILPAIAGVLLIWEVAVGLSSASENTSGVTYILGLLVGLVAILVVAAPFVTMALYPAEGYAALAPPPPVEESPGAGDDLGSEHDADMVDGEFGDDEFGDDEFDDGGFDEDEYEDSEEDFEDDDELW